MRVPCSALALALAAATLAVGPAGTAAADPVAQPPGPTRARIATFNVLGYGHTMPGGDRKGFADGRTRQQTADQLIAANHLDIVGFQEMEAPQIEQFQADLGPAYELWPGFDYTGSAEVNVRGNSIAWRKDLWTAVEKTYYDAPYFKGKNVPRPIVLLRNNVTGQQVYVTNTHNPADTQGDAQQWRNRSVDIQAATINALRAAHPDVPVVFTGDMNDRARFYCRITAKTTLRAANGGTRTAKKCTLPPSPQIDWIMGTPDVVWSGYRQLRSAAVKRASDHPLVWADAEIQPVPAQHIDRVLVIDVSGLPSAAISGRNARFAPRLNRLIRSGAATLNARTDTETSAPLPNLLSLLTGRPAARKAGGHGVTAGGRMRRYAASLFDSVHDWGGTTSFLSSDRAASVVLHAYNKGKADKQGVRYGRDKLTVSSVRGSDAAVTRAVRSQLRHRPRTVSVVQLTGPREAGQEHGFHSRAYHRAVRRLDKRIGAIKAAVARNPRLARSTLVVVTADSGGAGRSVRGRSLQHQRVPFVVWGSGVPAGADLYRLNPAYADPGAARPGYSGPQPVRVADVANLVTGVLGYPRVPHSRIRPTQDFNVFVTS